ncbi:flagellar hook-basal body complex protein FliE [Methylobacillus flagellatus]|uniref:flagellar hook-basal body complex protein FliE n=1 Tax=Methylobacillus flagellatus TaxID=405 RepID=UPI0010F49515|nr:flagellar hook-basal body complex protein FliE [Methylobacillus flagellatus]
MAIEGIDASRIQSMLSQLKQAAQRPDTAALPAAGTASAQGTQKLDFAEALKASLNQVNSMQLQSEKLGQQFVMGDDKVSLSDVMITGQKAGIAFQATVQVRNKLVSAYQDIMNMQV